ncbi:Bgt-20708 [Blumeria graminis f. sp. tritici]|uniref:Bgt-20708 n=2 Tax=Blumeria graminis f. sp. tritici TaxID=62690 RepID=A0A9X9MH39_BLUGR|nr:Bgt-20708 [Blumeria graminis f. sp. tritici]
MCHSFIDVYTLNDSRKICIYLCAKGINQISGLLEQVFRQEEKRKREKRRLIYHSQLNFRYFK